MRVVVRRLATDYFFAEDFFAEDLLAPDFFAVLFVDAEPPDFLAVDLDDDFFAELFLLPVDLVPVDLVPDFADDFFADDFVELDFEPLDVLVAISYLFSFKFWWMPCDHKIMY